jgi:kelch-like protein 20
VAVLDGYLYAVGGQDGVSCLNYVERYDPKENKWSKVASMNTRRLGVAVAVLGGYLYAVGGSDGQMPLNTGNKYLTLDFLGTN